MKTKTIQNNLFPQIITLVYGTPEEFHDFASEECGVEIQISAERLKQIDGCFFERIHENGEYTCSFVFINNHMETFQLNEVLILSHEALHCAINMMQHFCFHDDNFTISTQVEEEVFVKLHEYYAGEIIMFAKECIDNSIEEVN